VTAWVIELKLAADGRLQVTPSLRELRGTVRQDPLVRDRVAGWMQSHETAFCKGAGFESPTCLSVPLGLAETHLVASEEKIRGTETSLGNWIADQMVEAFTDCQADAAFINSGSLRLNHDLPRGTEITRRHIEELIQYPTPLYLFELSREQLQDAIRNSISRRGSGGWLQVSRLAFVYEPSTGTVSKLLVKPPGPGQAINVATAQSRNFRVVASQYMTVGEDDGYDKILPQIKDAIACEASGTDLKTILYGALEGKRRIGPEEEGRVCTAHDAKIKDCQANTWLR
jgi:2',3'-cyclic-nucleotide 2'-phosphodiesterase (5'-nucleotidase family)